MPNTSDIKNGAVLLENGKRMKVLEFLHVKPGKGNAFVRTKLRDLQSGKIIEKRFNAGAKIAFVRIDAKEMQYLYNDGDAIPSVSLPKSVPPSLIKFMI